MRQHDQQKQMLAIIIINAFPILGLVSSLVSIFGLEVKLPGYRD